MNVYGFRWLVVALSLVAGRSHASPTSPVGESSESVGHYLSLALDGGVEASLLGSATRHGGDVALGMEVALIAFDDRLRGWDAWTTDSHGARVRLAPQWPWWSHPTFEVHVGGVVALTSDRRQARASLASGLGALGVGVSTAVEFAGGAHAWAVGPELRLRHRFGPAERSPSIGVVLRADAFLARGTGREDRVTLGVVGMFDWL